MGKRVPRKEIMAWLKIKDRFSGTEFKERFNDNFSHYCTPYCEERKNWIKTYVGHPSLIKKNGKATMRRDHVYIRKGTLGGGPKEAFTKYKQKELIFHLLFDYKNKIDTIEQMILYMGAEITEMKKMMEEIKNGNKNTAVPERKETG